MAAKTQGGIRLSAVSAGGRRGRGRPGQGTPATGSFTPAAKAWGAFHRPGLLRAPSRLALGTARVTPSVRAGMWGWGLPRPHGGSEPGKSPSLRGLCPGEGEGWGGLGVGVGMSPPLVSAVTSNCRLGTSHLNYFYRKRPNYILTRIAAERNECSRS